MTYSTYEFISIYKKPDGELTYRATEHKPETAVGHCNSYGWKLLSIQKINEGKVISMDEYDALLRSRRKKEEWFRKIKWTIQKIDFAKLAEWFMLFIFAQRFM